MVSSAALTRVDWRSMADAQAGMVSRGQLLALGISPMQARAHVGTGRWRRVLPGVYATFTGRSPRTVGCGLRCCTPGGTPRRVIGTALYL